MSEINSSSWNFFKTYQHITQGLPRFSDRLGGLTRVVIGRLDATKFVSHSGGAFSQSYTPDYSENHYGLYDLCTLTLLYKLENFCWGESFEPTHGRQTWLKVGLVLGWTWVGVGLTLARYAVGFATAATLVIPLFLHNLYKINFSSKSNSNKTQTQSLKSSSNEVENQNKDENRLSQESTFSKDEFILNHAENNRKKLIYVINSIDNMGSDSSIYKSAKIKACKYYDKALADYKVLNECANNPSELSAELSYLKDLETRINGFREGAMKNADVIVSSDNIADGLKNGHILNIAFRNYQKLETVLGQNYLNKENGKEVLKRKATQYYDKAWAGYQSMNTTEDNAHYRTRLRNLELYKKEIDAIQVRGQSETKSGFGGFFKRK